MAIKSKSGTRGGHVLVPIQLGEALLPRVDFEATTSWRTRDTHGQNTFHDRVFDHARRSPLEVGEMTFSAKYRVCSRCSDCIGCDYDKTNAYLGVWTPLVVARVPQSTGNICGDCCSHFMWTMAKLTEVEDQSSMDSFKGKTDPFTFKFLLAEPFWAVDNSQWRYGMSSKFFNHNCSTLQEIETFLFSSSEHACELFSNIPCQIPDCCPARCVDQRFFFRPMDCDPCESLAMMLSFPNRMLVSSECRYADVVGGFEPLTIIYNITDGATVTITSDTLGTQTYTNNTGGGVTIGAYGDMTDDECSAVSLCDTLRLGIGSNKIDVLNGSATVAWRPRWLR